MDDAAAIAHMRVRRELERRGKSMRWLSEKARIGSGGARDALVTAKHGGRLDTWLRIAGALGMTLDELAKEEEA